MLPEDADAQRRRKKKKKKKKTEQRAKDAVPFKDRLWYGAGGALGYGGTFIGSIPANILVVGLNPMVGYKVNNWLSAGPRLDVTYLSGRGRTQGGTDVYKIKAFNYGVGPFARAKVPFGIFAHTEYQWKSEVLTTGQLTVDNKFETVRQSTTAAYVGLGYNNSGSGFSTWGYEFYATYNLLAPDDWSIPPLDYRVALTYRF